jgi:hypothetical protein
MIRSGQLALRWPNNYCQEFAQGNWGALANVFRKVQGQAGPCVCRESDKCVGCEEELLRLQRPGEVEA